MNAGGAPLPVPAAAASDARERGRCRICKCVEWRACVQSEAEDWFGPCSWADATETLCTNPDCLEARAREIEGDSDNPLRVAEANELYALAAASRDGGQ